MGLPSLPSDNQNPLPGLAPFFRSAGLRHMQALGHFTSQHVYLRHSAIKSLVQQTLEQD